MTVEDVVRTHTEGFNRALTTHDLDALSAIYADDYMLVRPDGSVLGKEDVLRDLGAGSACTIAADSDWRTSRVRRSPFEERRKRRGLHSRHRSDSLRRERPD